jgi:hypothetical protein
MRHRLREVQIAVDALELKAEGISVVSAPCLRR